MILVSIEEHDRSEHERQCLHLFAQGVREITSGAGFTLDAVLADADALLVGDSE
jgi:hypothetical protein